MSVQLSTSHVVFTLFTQKNTGIKPDHCLTKLALRKTSTWCQRGILQEFCRHRNKDGCVQWRKVNADWGNGVNRDVWRHPGASDDRKGCFRVHRILHVPDKWSLRDNIPLQDQTVFRNVCSEQLQVPFCVDICFEGKTLVASSLTLDAKGGRPSFLFDSLSESHRVMNRPILISVFPSGIFQSLLCEAWACFVFPQQENPQKPRPG